MTQPPLPHHEEARNPGMRISVWEKHTSVGKPPLWRLKVVEGPMSDPSNMTAVVAVWLLQTFPAIEELEAAGRDDLADSLLEILQELLALYSKRLPDLPDEFQRLSREVYGDQPSPLGRSQ